MPLLTHALTTLARVKEYLGITDVGSDTFLENLINRATDWLEARTNRRFLLTTYTSELYDGGEEILFLNQYPITELTFLKYRVGTIASPIWQAFSTNDYVLYGKAGYVKFLLGTTPKNVQNIQVSYKAGYKIDFANINDPTKHTLPLDVESAVVSLVADVYNKSQSSGIQSESVEGASITYFSEGKTFEANEEAQAVIKKYGKKIVTSQQAI